MLGGERSMLATLPAVVAAGFDVVVAGPPCGALATALRERGITHVAWETHGETQRRQPLAELRSSLNAIAQQLRPDLVHANSLSTARIAGPMLEANGIRSIGHLRDIINLSKNVVADLNCHNLLIAVSDATRRFHVAQGLDRAKCAVIYNGVDLNEFRPRRGTGYLHRELRLPSDVQLIAVIGQLGLR
jgi:glycosyltransferase involved in cell wall biosynthesis